eukprot:5732273-Prymnesium_polylepis.1
MRSAQPDATPSETATLGGAQYQSVPMLAYHRPMNQPPAAHPLSPCACPQHRGASAAFAHCSRPQSTPPSRPSVAAHTAALRPCRGPDHARSSRGPDHAPSSSPASRSASITSSHHAPSGGREPSAAASAALRSWSHGVRVAARFRNVPAEARMVRCAGSGMGRRLQVPAEARVPPHVQQSRWDTHSRGGCESRVVGEARSRLREHFVHERHILRRQPPTPAARALAPGQHAEQRDVAAAHCHRDEARAERRLDAVAEALVVGGGGA